MLRIVLALLIASPLAMGCKRGSEPRAEVSEETRPSPDRGSAGGFSASLSADLEVRGSGAKGSGDFFSDVGSDSPAGSGSDTNASANPGADTGTANTGAANTGAANTGAASTGAASTGTNTGAANTGTTNTGTNTGTASTGTNTGTASTGTNTGSASTGPNTGAANTSAANTGAANTSAATTNAGSATAGSADEIEMTPVAPPKAPIAMTPELKAIKLSLLPNWKRDVVEPATISLEVEVQSKDVKETFMFHYGYIDAKAPKDREAYKKYLADAKIMKVTTDRQRGAAWYLEGNDAAGQLAFVLVVTWGGQRLFCGGSSYKDNGLGDIRDEVVVQAKKICETVAL